MSRQTLLAALVLSALTPTAFADLDREREINRGLTSLSSTEQAEVFYKRSSLAKGKTADYTIRLEAGKNYGIYADCDDNCNDIDTDLLLNGKVIDSDHLSDSSPILRVNNVAKTQDYVVRATMVDCSTNACDYHVQAINSGDRMPTSNNGDDDNFTPAQYLDAQRDYNLNSSGNTRGSAGELLYKRSSMAAGAQKTYHVNLTAGQAYKFYADCSPKQCSDINLSLSHNGSVVEEDKLPDPFPLFSYTANTTGRYTLRADMVSCQANKCDYNVHALENKNADVIGDDDYDDDVENLTPEQYLDGERIKNIVLATESDDKTAEVFYRREKIADRKTADYRVNLKANHSYRVFVDCSPTACSDVDAELWQNGKKVDSDTADDVYPMLVIAPKPRDSEYTVRVDMVKCKQDSCDVSVQVVNTGKSE